MKTLRTHGYVLFFIMAALVLTAPTWAFAQTTFSRIVVFGDSLSDPGNLFAMEGGQYTPPYATLGPFPIPDKAYSIGGHHFTNGATWIEQLGRSLDLAGNTRPAFQGSETEATNYAVSGARAHEDWINTNFGTQVNTFLNRFGPTAPSDALYVVEFGSNDIRDALEAEYAGGSIIADALTSIANNLGVLYAAGAKKFLICNAPDFSLTPAVLAIDKLNPGAAFFARYLSATYNSGLASILDSMAGLPGIEIVRLDFFQKLNEMVADREAFGLAVVDAPCITPNIAPYICRNPDQYLFWDGAHPTKAAHGIIAQEAAARLAE